jgi:uncharacterized membrane protein YfcA
MYDLSLLAVSIIAGGVASITGFGIGSLITPVLSLSIGTKLSVALVSIPHFIATGIRFAMLRSHVDRRVLFGFGVMSIAGGLTGAVLQAKFTTPALTLIFGTILLFSGFMGASGLSEKMRFRGFFAWFAGATSGFLGGLVGNQGGIRSAALLGANISKESFVATATAIGLAVDLARMPVYFWMDANGIFGHGNGKWILISVCGAVAGTLLGTKLLKRLPELAFRRTVSALIFILGAFMFYEGLK